MEPRDKRLARWVAAGLIDDATADRLQAFERERAEGGGRRGPILFALGFGGLLVAAGILLFVSANWDQMSPSSRVAAVVSMVAAFHIGGALAAGRFEALAVTLHAVGTIALGAGIFLVGQIYHLDVHWPAGVMLWAIGAWAAWWLRRDWPQLALALVLTPQWLQSEWTSRGVSWNAISAPVVGWFLLALAYLTIERERWDRAAERTVSWLGALMFLPVSVSLAMNAAMQFGPPGRWNTPGSVPASAGMGAVAWLVATAVPLAAAAVLRREAAWLNGAAAVWAVALVNLSVVFETRTWVYPWLGIGCVGVTLWGLREARVAVVNLATGAFAITVMAFYFDTVMTKMDKSVSLVGLGLLFLVGGYLLERLRRRMLGTLAGGRS